MAIINMMTINVASRLTQLLILKIGLLASSNRRLQSLERLRGRPRTVPVATRHGEVTLTVKFPGPGSFHPLPQNGCTYRLYIPLHVSEMLFSETVPPTGS